MAIAIGPSGITSANASGTSVTVSTPTVRPDGSALQNGDLLLFVLCAQGASTVSSGVPSGWSQTQDAPFAGANGPLIDVFYRYRTGTEAGSYAVGTTATKLLQAFMLSVTGAVTSGDPFEDGIGTDSVANGVTITYLSLNPVAADNMLLCIGTGQANNLTSTSTIGTISGMTEALDFPTGATATRKGVTSLNYLQLTTTTATGTRTATMSDSAGQNTGVTLLLKTAAPTGPTETAGMIPI